VTRYVLDTNLYIEAARDRSKAEELKSFSSAFLPFLYLHAVVAQELMAGAVSAKWRRDIERGVVGPFERRGRIVLPSYPAWKRSGEVVAELVRRRAISPGGVRHSFLNDVVLATSCREGGFVLVTRNRSDFELIAKVESVRFEEPWPER
jgi:predicted nucleic acid-binding protein